MTKYQVASGKKSLGSPIQGSAREGEGHSVALTIVNVVKNKTNGTEIVQYGLDISQARVPQRRYAAELGNIRAQDNELRFTFAIRTVSGDGFDSVLVVRLSPDAARNFSESLKTLAEPTIDQILDQVGATREALQPIDKNPENVSNVANMVANFVAVGVSGYETTLDFYHASAFAMGTMQRSKSLDMDPKVRVDIRTSLFASLIDQIPALLQNLSAAKQKENV